MFYMMGSKSVLQYLAVCVWLLRGIVTLNNGTMFKRNSLLDGYDCPANETLFSISTAMSKAECIKICVTVFGNNCRSVFIVDQTTNVICHGCLQVYSGSSSLQPLPLSKYYHVDSDNATSNEFRWNSSVYQIIPGLQTFDGGIAACADNGGHLAVFETIPEFTYVRSTLAERLAEDLWIGATRSTKSWFWVPTNTSLEFYGWAPSKPKSSDCVLLTREWTYLWVDEPCTYKHYCLCESYEP